MNIKKQEDIRDCGLTILQAFHKNFYNKWININELKKKSSYGVNGINVEGLSSVAKEFGLLLTPMKGSWKAFVEHEFAEPIIVLFGNKMANHYVVVIAKNNKYITILDPMSGTKKRILFHQFENLYMGIIIKVKKTNYKYKRTKHNSIFTIFSSYKKALPWLTVSMFFSVATMFISGFLMKIIFDIVIPSSSQRTLILIILSFITLSLFATINNWFKNFIIYKISLQIHFDLIEKFNYQLINAKTMKLNSLKTNDLLRRMNLLEPISTFLSATLFGIAAEIITFFISAAILIWIDVQLFLICLFSLILLLIVTTLFQYKINNKYGIFMENQLKFSTCVLDMANTTKQLKNVNYKNFNMVNFNRSFYNFKKVDKKIWILNHLKSSVEDFFINITSMILIYFSTLKVIQSSFSVGSMILFSTVFKYFAHPLQTTTNLMIKYPLVKKEINLLNYIFQLPVEAKNKKGHQIKELKSIDFKNFQFNFEEGKNILNVNNVKIDDSFKLVGENGEGKSTLLEVLSFQHPMKGLYINDIEMQFHSLRHLREQVAYIKEEYIPNEKTIDYITLKNERFKNNLIKALENKSLRKVIENINLELEGFLLNNASNASSGQRQLIHILKLFCKEYKLILLDEAFEHITDENFVLIKKAILEKQPNALFVEVSHSKRFIKSKKGVNIEKFKQNI